MRGSGAHTPAPGPAAVAGSIDESCVNPANHWLALSLDWIEKEEPASGGAGAVVDDDDDDDDDVMFFFRRTETD